MGQLWSRRVFWRILCFGRNCEWLGERSCCASGANSYFLGGMANFRAGTPPPPLKGPPGNRDQLILFYVTPTGSKLWISSTLILDHTKDQLTFYPIQGLILFHATGRALRTVTRDTNILIMVAYISVIIFTYSRAGASEAVYYCY